MPSSSKSHVGGLIRAARERRRWTQADLGDRVGVDRKTVDNWENGRTSPRNRIGALEEILGIALRDDGYEDSDESTANPEVVDAILRDDALIEDAKQHLLNQYELLLRLPRDAAHTRVERTTRRADRPAVPPLRAVARGGDPKDRAEVQRLAREARRQHEQNTGNDE